MSTPAGWHKQDDGRERFWDGTQWTEQFRAAPSQASAPAGWHKQQDGRERFWDGTEWTEQFRDATPEWVVPAAPGAVAGRPLRPWYKKKRFLIPGGLVALAIFGAALPDAEPDSTPASAVSSTSSSSSSSPSSDSAAAEAAAAKASADAAAKAKADAAAKAKADAAAKAKAAAAAKAKAAAAAKAKAALRNPANYPAITPRKYALLVKDPDAHVGQKFRIYGYVTQFDSATGPDTFLADTAAVRASEWYDYDVNTLVSADNANLFKNVVEDDLVTLYVQVLGSQSYDTQIGGNTTVPHLQANMVKVTGSGG